MHEDEYFADFPNMNLLRNHPPDENGRHDRPYFFAFYDQRNPDIYWMIPLSSRTTKYQSMHDAHVQKYGYCDTIFMGKIFGCTQAVLIQNICPVSARYINNLYASNGKPLRTSVSTTREIQQKAKSVLAKHEHKQLALLSCDVNASYSTIEWVIMLDEAAAEAPSASTAQTSANRRHKQGLVMSVRPKRKQCGVY